MATALRSGADFLTYWATAPADVSGTVYAGTNQNGSVGPGAGTHMTFVGQYLGVISAAQLAALNGQGLSVFFYYENSGAGSIQPQFNSNYLAATTFAQGQIDGTAAKNWLNNTLGIATQPVYFAVDYDVNDFTVATKLNAYFSGVASVMGAANTGLYGDGFIFGALLQLSGGAYPTWFTQSKSNGWAGNGNFISGMNLWQWPPGPNGYSPDGNLTINGHAVDGVFSYTNDFGQYPRPSNPSSGQLNTITSVPVATTFTQAYPSAITVPNNTYDKIMFSTTYNTTVTNSVGSYNVSGPTTNLGQTAYPIGNFSYDGGNTWNDFGFIFGGDFGSFVGELPAVVVQPVVSSSGTLSFVVAVNSTVGGGGTIPLIIHAALLQTYSPSDLPVSSVTQPLGYSSANPTAGPIGIFSQTTAIGDITGADLLKTYAAYRRIHLDGTSGTGVHTISHGQSSTPNIMVWTQDTSNNTLINPVVWHSGGADVTHFGLKIGASTFTINVDAANLNNAFYRVYSDN